MMVVANVGYRPMSGLVSGFSHGNGLALATTHDLDYRLLSLPQELRCGSDHIQPSNDVDMPLAFWFLPGQSPTARGSYRRRQVR